MCRCTCIFSRCIWLKGLSRTSFDLFRKTQPGRSRHVLSSIKSPWDLFPRGILSPSKPSVLTWGKICITRMWVWLYKRVIWSTIYSIEWQMHFSFQAMYRSSRIILSKIWSSTIPRGLRVYRIEMFLRILSYVTVNQQLLPSPARILGLILLSAWMQYLYCITDDRLKPDHAADLKRVEKRPTLAFFSELCLTPYTFLTEYVFPADMFSAMFFLRLFGSKR